MRHAHLWASASLALAVGVHAASAQVRAATPGSTLVFERNTGRFDRSVRFVARLGAGRVLFVTDGGAVLTLGGDANETLLRAADTPLRLTFAGSKGAAAAVGLAMQPGVVNYLIGNDPARWRTRVPTYARVRMARVYPGIAVEYYGRQATDARERGPVLEFDFLVQPGADPSLIRLRIDGATQVEVDGGELSLATGAGRVRLRRPAAYQVVGGRRVAVACRYVLLGREVRLRLARYNRGLPLVIDPVLEYSTFLGGTGADEGNGIAVDASGSAYIAGATHSADFPTTAGAYDTTKASGWDICVTKLNAAGSALVYSTFIGGSGSEHGQDVAVDSAGSAYVVAHTTSTDYPTTPSAFDTTANGGTDVVVTKLSPAGDAVLYSSYLGGAQDDTCSAVALDSTGSAYVVGDTRSGGFPTTAGAYDTTHNGETDAYVTKLSPDGGTLAFSTFVGALYYDYCHDVAVDGSGCAYIVGETRSTTFPTTPGAFDTTHADPVLWVSDAFVTKLAPSGDALVYSTFLGGADWDEGRAIAVDSTGAAYVTGETESADYPVTPGAYDTTYSTYWDVFVTKLNPAGSALAYSTYIGNADGDWGTGIAVDYTGSAWVTGRTLGPLFPTTADALDTTHNGGLDAYVARVTPNGAGLAYATFMGGSSDDRGNRITLDAAGGIYIGGTTGSTGFPTTSEAFDRSQNGGNDIFIAKFTAPVDTDIYVPDRTGTITELVALRGYLRRISDGAWLAAKPLTFEVDGEPVGSAVTGATGRAELLWAIPDGSVSRTVAVAFAGDGQYNPSSDSGPLTCQTWATKMTGVNREGKITAYRILKAWLWEMDNSPVAGKSITFSLDGTLLGSDNTRSTGLAQIGYTIADGAGAGTRTILAEWVGDGGYLPSSCTNTLNVLKATPYIWVMPRSVAQGGIARLYAYFRRLADYQKQEGKTVTFRIGGTWIADVVTLSGAEAGIARYSYTTTEPPGMHIIRCEFAGDAWVDAGYGEANLTIY